MEKEQILDFTRRISQSNRSGLTVINYEIIFAYLDDAKKAYQEEKWEEFKVALRKAQNSIGELMQTLDFSYDISRNLYRIYVFCKDSLAAAMYKRSLTEIENAEKMLRKLYQNFIDRRGLPYVFYKRNMQRINTIRFLRMTSTRPHVHCRMLIITWKMLSIRI